MIRWFIAQLLCILLTLTLPAPVLGKAASPEKQPTVQERLVLLPQGSVIEVKTTSKEKIKGKLGALATDSFEMQVAKGASVEKRSIRFAEVKKLTDKGLPESKARSISTTIVAGAIAGVVAVVVLIAILASHGG
jgi:flagellar biosynthesis/type III secretory pathway M-ring protein FliF/YscJ